ncbi:hypothetical protein F5Y15DRAFT_221058 [Xylariaceae sp. FL0016]|nr:hypothetical protein F5Y15DRAFT_221058 [Xylariaceae sp. FL0016]
MVVDYAQIQQKYTEEALKRVRAEGLGQYEPLEQSDSERLRHLVDDTWADHAALDAQAPPIQSGDRVKFLIAGAGIGGLVSAVRLIQQGFRADQIRLVETAGGVGGTWYWNRYPGLHCDVEAYVYMPLLEELGYMPSHKYASGVEIRHHLAAAARKFQLDDKILFRSQVKKTAWDEGAKLWNVDITSGRGPRGQDTSELSIQAEFVLLTAGLLTKPQMPKVGGVGVAGFQGAVFHTSRWQFDVTGGSPEDTFPDMSKLKDKRVGIIGTGATAVQAVPCLAQYAKELYVFQRTPSAVYSRGQKATDPEEWRGTIAARPGWHDARMDNFAGIITKTLPPGSPDLVHDEWSSQPAYCALVGDPASADTPPDKVPDLIAHYQALDAPHNAALRQRVADIVRDPETAAALTPWYPVWCKRPTFSDTYLQTFNAPHVHLVDTAGAGIEAVSETAVRAGGKEYPLDVLVLGTGYRTPAFDGGDPSVRAGAQVYGRGGRALGDKIAAEGFATLYGVATGGFPNLFWIGPSQAGVEANHQHSIDVQCRLIAYMAATAHDLAGAGRGEGDGRAVLEVEAEAEQAWSMRIARGAARFAAMTVCGPSYFNAEKGPGMRQRSPQEMMMAARRATWGAGLPLFVEELNRWKKGGEMKGVTVGVA